MIAKPKSSGRNNQSKNSGARVGITFRIVLGVLVGGVLLTLIFWMLLAVSYCIPEEWLTKNVGESSAILLGEGDSPTSYVGEKFDAATGRIDNFTAAIMVSTASYSSGNPFTESLAAPKFAREGNTQVENLAESLLSEANSTYLRYWNGYLVVLKPLLVFFNIKQIRIIFQTIMLLLLGVESMLMMRRMQSFGVGLALSLLLSFGLFCGMDAAATLPMFFSLAISLGASLWVMCIKSFDINKLFMGFFVIVALTVFFDFLDNPILTLGFPLIILLARRLVDFSNNETNCEFIKGNAVLLISVSLGWIVGYGYLWSLKWILTTLVVGQDVIGNALNQAAVRTGANNGSSDTISVLGALSLNISAMGFVRYILLVSAVLFLTSVAYGLFRGLRKERRGIRAQKGLSGDWTTVVSTLGCLAMAAIIPYIWFAVLSNHSCIHYWFTYRDQMITLFAMLSGISIATNYYVVQRRESILKPTKQS